MSMQVGKWANKRKNEQASLETSNEQPNKPTSGVMNKWAGQWANERAYEQTSRHMSKWESKWAGKWANVQANEAKIIIPKLGLWLWSLNLVFEARFSTTFVIIITTHTPTTYFFSASAASYGILQMSFDQNFINIGPGHSSQVQVISAMSDFPKKWPPLKKSGSLICRGEI